MSRSSLGGGNAGWHSDANLSQSVGMSVGSRSIPNNTVTILPMTLSSTNEDATRYALTTTGMGATQDSDVPKLVVYKAGLYLVSGYIHWSSSNLVGVRELWLRAKQASPGGGPTEQWQDIFVDQMAEAADIENLILPQQIVVIPSDSVPLGLWINAWQNSGDWLSVNNASFFIQSLLDF
jgi:hypothetical protein